MKKLYELKISQAPWKVRKENSGFYVANSDGTGVASLVRYYSNLDCIIADASIVAAAPKLYEALLEMVEMYRDGGSYDYEQKVIAKAKAALAEAAGESEVRHDA